MNSQFPIFSFEELVEDVSAGNRKVAKGDYLAHGSYPVVDQGQDYVGGYTDDRSNLVNGDSPWIVFGDHTRALKFIDFPFCMGADGVKVLRPRAKKHLDTKYLYHFLQANEIPSAGYSRHYKFLKRLGIPLPSLDEQRRIAAILDKADALRQKRKQAIALLDSMTQAIFLEMFGIVSLPPINIRKQLPALPNGWSWEKLNTVARLATGHTPDRKKKIYWNGSIPWLTLGDIRLLDGKITSNTREKVSKAGIDNSSAVILPAGTVCFSRTASVGFVTMAGVPMATSQDFVNWVCGEYLLPKFLMSALIASRSELLSLASGSTHRTIYFPTVQQFTVAVPPLILQEAFVEKAKTIDSLLPSLDRAMRAADSLFTSLQSRAFSGQL